MKILKQQGFASPGAEKYLVKFVNTNGIKREDILVIAPDGDGGYTIFYYGEA